MRFIFILFMMVIVGACCPNTENATKQQAQKLSELQLGDWGPRETIAGQMFNTQSGGKSGLWIQVSGLDLSSNIEVHFGGHVLPDSHATDKLVTAAVPVEMLKEPGDKEVVVVETSTGRKLPVGLFLIKQ